MFQIKTQYTLYQSQSFCRFWPARLLGTVGKLVVFTAKRVGKVQCFIFYSTSNLPISFKFLQVFTYYERKIMCEFH